MAVEKAMEKTKQSCKCFYKAIFMDCLVPVLDGFEASIKHNNMMNNG